MLRNLQNVSDPRFLTVPQGKSPWRYIASMCGSQSESLSVAIAAKVEIEYLTLAIQNDDLPSGMSLGQRFFAESLAQKVIELAHRSFNIGYRTLALNSQIQQVLLNQCSSKNKCSSKPCASDPDECIRLKLFTTDRRSWQNFQEGNAQRLVDAARETDHPSILAIAETLHKFAQSDSWKQVEEQRGQDFHRLRLESSELAGVDQSTGWHQDIQDGDGNVIGYEENLNETRYSAGDGETKRVINAATSGLHGISETMENLRINILKAVEPLTFGQTTFTGQYPSYHSRKWDRSTCGCCSKQE